MFAHQRKRMQLLFATADALLTVVSFEVAYFTRIHLRIPKIFSLTLQTNIVLALCCAAVWVLFGWQRRISEYAVRASLPRLLKETLRQCLLGMVLLVVLQYLLNLGHELSRGFLALFVLYNFTALLLFRSQASSLLGAFQREFGQAYHVVLVGAPTKVAGLKRQLTESSPFRLHIPAILTPEEAGEAIPAMLSRQVVDEVIFDVDWSALGALEPVLQHCDEEGVRTRVTMGFFPHVNSQITLDKAGNVPLLTFSADPLEDLRLLVKRAIDVVLSIVSIVLLLPVFALIVLLIKLTSPGPMIFRQSRCGLNGRQFTLYKFRSMVENADALKAQLAHLNEREIAFKLSHDPRVTTLGRILRKFSLDELPQLYNVLRGDMSLVGPRPPLPDEVAKYQRWQKRRLRMRPGLTCLWATMGRDGLDFNSWMRTDLFYIDNWSLALDWVIILRTIPYVLAGRGAH